MLGPIALASLLTLVLPVSIDIDVPDDYDTIQEAIDAAEDGDVITVQAGTYVENIDLLGKAITLTSADGPDDTIIDGSDLTLGEDFGCVIYLGNLEDEDTIISGFTITGGYASFGGVMYNSGVDVTVTNCRFTGNAAAFGAVVTNVNRANVRMIRCTPPVWPT